MFRSPDKATTVFLFGVRGCMLLSSKVFLGVSHMAQQRYRILRSNREKERDILAAILELISTMDILDTLW